MMHPERVEDYLEHISLAIVRASRYVEPLDNAQALEQNEQVQDAVLRNIMIIGEAAAKICKMDSTFVTAHPEIPWIEMRGIRNKIVHDYFDIDWYVVWLTVKDDLPRLKEQIDSLLSKRRLS